MPITGDFNLLKELRTKIGKITEPRFKMELAQLLGASAIAELRKEFARSVNPYGVAWKPLEHRKGQPLRDTGRLQNSFHYLADEKGFTVLSNVSYAAVHQNGATIGAHTRAAQTLKFNRAGKFTKGSAKRPAKSLSVLPRTQQSYQIPRRQMLPDRAGGLGPVWAQTFERTSRSYMKNKMGRK